MELLAALGVLVLAAVGAVLGFRSARRRVPAIDPFTVGEPWRQFVQQALQGRARFQQAVDATAPGPLRERLEDIGRRVDAAVDECWQIARRGHLMDRAVRSLGIESVRTRLDQTPDNSDPAATDALQAQLSSAERMALVAADARQRLQVLDARLGETVARATELSLRAGELTELGPLGTDVDQVVTDMEALRQALDEVDGGRRLGRGG